MSVRSFVARGGGISAMSHLQRAARSKDRGTQQPLPLMSRTKGIDCCKPLFFFRKY